MKKIVVAFPRNRYVTANDGSAVSYPIMQNLMEVMGSSDNLRWELTIFAVSSANARMQISLYEGTRSEPRPSTNLLSGVALGSAFPVAGALTPGVIAPNQVAAPFGGVVDAVMKVWQNAGGGTQEWVDMEARLTAHTT